MLIHLATNYVSVFLGVLIRISRDISSMLSSCFDSDSGPPKKKDHRLHHDRGGAQASWNFEQNDQWRVDFLRSSSKGDT